MKEFKVIYAATNDHIKMRSIELTIQAPSMEYAESYALTFMEMAFGVGNVFKHFAIVSDKAIH